jgi:ABC-type Fe3+ transport system permease subunit
MRAVSRDQRELAAVYRAIRLETFWRIFLPGSMPFVLTGLCLAIGRGLIGIVVADLFGADKGLGLMVQQSAQTFDTARIFAVTVLLAALGIGLTALLQGFERRMHQGMLRIDRVSKRFAVPDGTLTVLDEVSLDVAGGEFLALVGPSGCGKTCCASSKAWRRPPAETSWSATTATAPPCG